MLSVFLVQGKHTLQQNLFPDTAQNCAHEKMCKNVLRVSLQADKLLMTIFGWTEKPASVWCWVCFSYVHLGENKIHTKKFYSEGCNILLLLKKLLQLFVHE